MKQSTKDRLATIAGEIRSLAFMAQKSKDARDQFNQIFSLAREACDYYAFGFEAPPPAPEPEPVEFGFSCPEPECWINHQPLDAPGYPTMREALDAADAHRAEHPTLGRVTYERPPAPMDEGRV